MALAAQSKERRWQIEKEKWPLTVRREREDLSQIFVKEVPTVVAGTVL